MWLAERNAVDPTRRFNATAHLWPTRRAVAARMAHVRGPMVQHFRDNPTDWNADEFPIDGLRDVLANRYMEPNRTMRHVVDNRLGSPRFDYRPIPGFQLEKMEGALVFVGPKDDGPWCLNEGTHRCVEIIKLHDRGEAPATTVKVVLGVCQKVRGWTFWPA